MKKNITRFGCLLLSLLMLLAVCGCSRGDTSNVTSERDEIEACINNICNNPDSGSFNSADDYITARQESYDKLISYGDRAVSYMVNQLRASKSMNLREVIMLIATSELTGVGTDLNYQTAAEWLEVYDKSLQETQETE